MSQRHLELKYKVECVEGEDRVLVGSEKCKECEDSPCQNVVGANTLYKAVKDAIEGLKTKKSEVKQPLTWEEIFPFTSTHIYR
jgi:hypothetical protein